MIQIFVFATFCLWALSLLGYGSLLREALLFFRADRAIEKEVFLASYGTSGLLFLAVAGLVLNFILPLSQVFSFAALVLGIVLFFFRSRKDMPPFSLTEYVILSSLLVFSSLFPLLPIEVTDTGLYHLPAINWIQQSRAVPGIANLQPELGYDSTWFITAAIVEPFRAITSRPFFLVDALFFFYFGSAALLSLKSFILKKMTFRSAFLALCAIPWALLLTNFVSSPSPDVAIMFLTFLVVYFLISGFSHEPWDACSLLLSLILSAFAVTVKSSALVLFLPAAAICLWGLARKSFKFPAVGTVRIVVSLLSMMVLWIGRNVIYSGCLVYPVAALRIATLKWAVRTGQIADEAGYIKAWARHPEVQWQTVLSNWDWLLPWLKGFLVSEGYLILAILFGIILVGIRLITRKKLVHQVQSGVLLFFLLLGIAFWFLVAPEIRFGYGILYAFAILLLCYGLFSPQWESAQISGRELSFQVAKRLIPQKSILAWALVSITGLFLGALLILRVAEPLIGLIRAKVHLLYDGEVTVSYFKKLGVLLIALCCAAGIALIALSTRRRSISAQGFVTKMPRSLILISAILLGFFVGWLLGTGLMVDHAVNFLKTRTHLVHSGEFIRSDMIRAGQLMMGFFFLAGIFTIVSAVRKTTLGPQDAFRRKLARGVFPGLLVLYGLFLFNPEVDLSFFLVPAAIPRVEQAVHRTPSGVVVYSPLAGVSNWDSAILSERKYDENIIIRTDRKGRATLIYCATDSGSPF